MVVIHIPVLVLDDGGCAMGVPFGCSHNHETIHTVDVIGVEMGAFQDDSEFGWEYDIRIHVAKPRVTIQRRKAHVDRSPLAEVSVGNIKGVGLDTLYVVVFAEFLGGFVFRRCHYNQPVELVFVGGEGFGKKIGVVYADYNSFNFHYVPCL
jgi:hypothetical protein